MRELREELGIDGPVDMLGQTRRLLRLRQQLPRHALAGRGDDEPHWQPDREVQQVVELPLDIAARRKRDRQHDNPPRPAHVSRPVLPHAGTCIWGATSVILSELADLLEIVTNEQSHAKA